jgi:hypothetical protein
MRAAGNGRFLKRLWEKAETRHPTTSKRKSRQRHRRPGHPPGPIFEACIARIFNEDVNKYQVRPHTRTVRGWGQEDAFE